jgi:hypothetical protein
MLEGRFRRPSPVGATRVAKARSSATLLRAIRRRGRFATLRGLRHSHRRAQCSALTRSKQASVPAKEIPSRPRTRVVAQLTQKGLSLRHFRACGNPVGRFLSLGSRFRGNDVKVFIHKDLWDCRWKAATSWLSLDQPGLVISCLEDMKPADANAEGADPPAGW